MRYAQFVVGPAGCGKSTYCSTIVKHCEALRRKVDVVNLDPAAEVFDYQPCVDIRELISVEDVMEDDDLKYGPNGGLIFCMEYLAEHLDWLSDQLGEMDDDYVLFDMPGQIELYTNSSAMLKLVKHLQDMNYRICGVFLIDSQFVSNVSKYMSAAFVALATMVNFEIPFVNVFSKFDLLDAEEKKQVEKFVEPVSDMLEEDAFLNSEWGKKFKKLTQAIAGIVDEYALVKFSVLNVTDEDSVNDLLLTVDNAIQFGEDSDVRVVDDLGDNGLC
ncbi:GPN-loop GTPase 3-like isoform X1 [Leptotrombidium deliense]|uniref:GPN-loop GTPase 3 n=1 Tax=Leptotrombidium deliense TaxID=299467 RepID=A0A443S6Z7_9ACAR|nr:GPN-loop GTPase 3-like isoform X1 [Leptotrombidium deliense]